MPLTPERRQLLLRVKRRVRMMRDAIRERKAVLAARQHRDHPDQTKPEDPKNVSRP